jgi:mRNA interferase MazF
MPTSPTPRAEPRRGEVWLAELDKIRPVVILTRDPMGRYLNSVIVGPVTSTVRGLSTEVALSAADGLLIASVANTDNVQLVDRSRLRRRVGRVRPSVMDQICTAVHIAIGCR